MKIRDLIIYPIIAGLVIGLIIQFVIPSFLKGKKELTYTISGPYIILDKELSNQLGLTIESNKLEYLISYNIILKNSGNTSIENLAILYKFENIPNNFKIYSFNEKTIPEFEFGRIDTLVSDSISRKLRYELINEDDEISVTFITNNKAEPKVFAKDKKLELKDSSLSKKNSINKYLSVIGAVIAILSSLISVTVKHFNEDLLSIFKLLFKQKRPSNQKDNIGEIFSGRWELIYARDGFQQSESVQIDNDGKYFVNGIHAFNLHNRIINKENKQIIFNKVRLNGEIHSNEILLMVNDRFIQGIDSLGFRLTYNKKE